MKNVKKRTIIVILVLAVGIGVTLGTKGSVRLDVVEYNRNGLISAIYDLKTGSASLTPARIAQIRNEVGTLAIPNVPVIEIHPK